MLLKIELSDPAAYEKSAAKIKPILEDAASNPEHQRRIEEFWDKASQYIGKLHGMNAALENGSADVESMSEILARETDLILNEGKTLEESIGNPEIIKKIKKLFRDCVIPLGVKSKIVTHAFTKPSGYAGDYGLIEIIYNNKPLSEGFGYCVDIRFQNDDYARAVRSRMKKMKEILARFLRDAGKGHVEILNIACGSCREIKEIFDESGFDNLKKAVFTLVDQDQEALDYSLAALKNSPQNVHYNAVRNSVYDYVKYPEQYRETLSGKDLIYTIGLADYIPDGALKSLITFFYSLLKPGGKLVIAHKDSKNFSPLAADWWCDWTFHLRDEEETVRLVRSSGITNFSVNVIRETETNIIFFMIIEKEK